ncbi:hypothetical protein F0U62_21070 [Cystobacter fuscus]|uniref:hypothetical protein n=1 Tax=Cystobacter fuscus TaxID=43 RepID=UPI002B2826A7|nr:hypothetical protein F0U62_21070 [Cystobacter fuscus]
MSIGNVRFVGGTPQFIPQANYLMANGHVFDFTIQMSFCSSSGGSADCILEWWEKINIPAVPGHAPNTWTDMYAHYSTSPTFDPWRNRTIPCPSGGNLTVVIVDIPSLGTAPGITQTRTLEFRLTVRSGAGCTCNHTSATATATQVLTMVNGQLVASSSSFTIGAVTTTP